MNKFLEEYHNKPIQEELGNLNYPVSIKEMESLIKNLLWGKFSICVVQ